MIRKGPVRSGSSGFTLVEVMVAIVMLMIVIGSIYGAFRSANLCASRTEERADVNQTARVLLAQMVSELQSAYQPAGAQEIIFTGEDTEAAESAPQYDTLVFMTTGHHSPSQLQADGDLCRVTYAVQTNADDEPEGFFVQEDFRPGLSMSEDDKGPAPIKLSELVVGLNCKYLDPTTDEWQNEWVDRQEMPRAVRVEMVLKPEREGATPIVVAATANLPMPTEQPSSETSPEPPPNGPLPEETGDG
jgi:type II secretion system protein J